MMKLLYICPVNRSLRSLQNLNNFKIILVWPFKCSLKLACFKLPYFNCAIFYTWCQVGKLRVKSKRSHYFLMGLHWVLSWSFQLIKIFHINISLITSSLTRFLKLLFESLTLLLKSSNFFLECQYGLPFHL